MHAVRSKDPMFLLPCFIKSGQLNLSDERKADRPQVRCGLQDLKERLTAGKVGATKVVEQRLLQKGDVCPDEALKMIVGLQNELILGKYCLIASFGLNSPFSRTLSSPC